MQHDARGLPLTAADAEAARRLDETVEAYLGFRRDTGDRLKAAFAADPQMPLAHVLRGYFMKLFSVPTLERKARESLHAAEAAAAAQGATERERRHIAALAAWCDGDFETARTRWEDILLHDPRDIVALKLATFLHFYLGDAANLRDSPARVLPAWDEATPGYGYVLGVHAFGLEESGDYAAAERVGRRAIELNPADIWAGHAVAHVMEMQGRQRDGIAWIDGLEAHWRGLNNFAFHVWWHRALYWFELCDYDRVLQLYDAEVRKELTDEYLDICNAAALLWRLEDRGVGVGARWQELAGRCATRADDHLMVFADMHFMMALAAGGTEEQADRMLASMRRATLSDATQARISAEVGLPLAEAIVAYRRGAFARAVELLLPIRYRIVRIGGSHAQRDVFQHILIQSALKAEQFPLARALLAERTAQRPFNAVAWTGLATACQALGDTAAATRARRQAETLKAA